MDWWVRVIIILAVIFLIVDWFIIMGMDPREWKGGGKDEQRKTGRRTGGRTEGRRKE